MKVYSVLLAFGMWPFLAMAQGYDRSVVEQNPEPDTSAPTVTVFLDNLRPPHIRIRPAGVTWIDMPYEVRVCEAALEFITATPLKPEDAQDKSVSILSINVDAKKMPDEIKQKLVMGQPVPPINLNCLLSAGQKSKIVIMLQISANASFLVNIQIKRKITIRDLSDPNNPGPEKSLEAEPATFAKKRKRAYELVYYKELRPFKPSEIHKVLLSSNAGKN